MFLLDTRSSRTRYDIAQPHFCETGWLDEAINWLGQLTMPGVLVLSQPFVEEPASWFQRTFHTMGDVNLPDYQLDHARLCNALFSAPHDILVVTGDIHWTRLYECQSGSRPGRRIFELSSSPLARIPQDSGNSAVGNAAGKVTWSGGFANWARIFARNAAVTYTTISVRPGADVGALSLDIRAWGADAKSDINLSCLEATTIVLR